VSFNLLNYSFSIQNYPIIEAQKELVLIQNNHSNNPDLYQENKKWEIFNHHIRKNKAYKNFIQDYKINDWTDIPVLTKKDIQVPLIDRLTEGYSIKNCHCHNTSGSSGTPFYFAKDKFCHAMSWAIIQNRFGWHDIEIGKDLQARFYGIPLTKSKYYKEKLKDFLAKRIRFSVFDLSDSVLEKYTTVFNNHPFTYINGYTSSLVLFSKYLVKNNLILKVICPTLKVVFATSEICDDFDKHIMEKGFGVKVVNEYGAAELDLIAFEDSVSNWLVNYETLFIEILNHQNKPVQEGEQGKVVITSLYNKAMPFIRYELGDMALLTNISKGPYKVLKNVVGRTNDIAILPSGKKSPGLTFYYISKTLLEGGGFMKEFIIKQKALNHFHLEYLAEREITESEKNKVKEAMNIYLEPGLEISFQRKEHIERTKAGKLKHFFSELESV
jgi:phenylacetate-CoA ligase